MDEEPITPDSPAEEPPVLKKKKLNLRPNTRLAVIEVLERARQRLPLDYKMVAGRHGCTWRTLKTLVSRFRRGEIELGVPDNAQEIAIDRKVEMQRSLASLDRLESLLCDSLDTLIIRSEKFHARGKMLAYRDMGVAFVLADLKSIQALRMAKEKGLITILRAAREERQLNEAIDIPTQVVNEASDAQIAAEALRNARLGETDGQE